MQGIPARWVGLTLLLALMCVTAYGAVLGIWAPCSVFYPPSMQLLSGTLYGPPCETSVALFFSLICVIHNPFSNHMIPTDSLLTSGGIVSILRNSWYRLPNSPSRRQVKEHVHGEERVGLSSGLEKGLLVLLLNIAFPEAWKYPECRVLVDRRVSSCWLSRNY